MPEQFTAEQLEQLDRLEQRVALLTEALTTAEAIDALRGVEPLAASGGPRGSAGPRPARMAAVAGRAQPSPSARSTSVTRPTITAAASAGSAGIVAGSVLESPEQLAELMAETLRTMGYDPSGPRRVLVASAKWDYPEDRRLGREPFENGRKFERVCSPRAVLASGGICLPVNVDYSVPTWATADRPLRDGLPAFQADRGGLRYATPPDIGVVDLQGTASGLGSATAVWTEATDANPASAVKPVYQVECGSEQLTYVNAVPTRVQFGNMQGRFAPEQLAANTELAIAAAAREAELELLTLLYNASTQVKTAEFLGATRDLLASVDIITAQYRSSHRFPRNISLTAIFPEWVKDLVRADLARELAHDNAGPVNVLAIIDQQIEEWFSTRGINVIWTLDGLKAGDYGTGGSAITNQYFPTVTAANTANSGNAITPQWPGQSSSAAFMVAWLLFVTGTYQFLDGGRLDLGVVRDSTLDATNDYETFVETFEGAAFRGIEAIQVQSMVQPSGGSASTLATIATSPYYHE
jgi:hypothetical protein